MKKVVICQYRLLHYRVGLFERLRQACGRRGVELELVHGQASRRESVKKDEGHLAWARQVENHFLEVGSIDLVWQPLPADLHDSDLVIVMQESRILSNYPLLMSRSWSARKVAYWGHGVNFQSDAPTGLREQWKSMMLNRVDWWFAYTELTVDILRRAGYAEDRVTCLSNAIDNDAFERDLDAVADEELQAAYEEIDADGSAPVGVFCGSLYPDKKLDFLVAVTDRIQSRIPGFRLVVIGDGPCRRDVESLAASRPWLKCMGVRKGKEKAAYFRIADVVLNPGLVGLHVLDAFCAGVPMVTTAEARHSPEIAYLRNNVNGLIVGGGVDAYAEAVIALLQDEERLMALKQRALVDAKKFTLEKMVSQFADGIERCLATPQKR